MLDAKKINKEANQFILSVLDSDSFVEIGERIEAGVITGYGRVNGALVYIFAQDRYIRAGSFGKMQLRKLLRLYNMAMRMKAPVIGFVDCAGIRIEEGAEALDSLAELYRIQAEASDEILQIMTICEECSDSMKTMASLSDIVLRNESDTSDIIRSLINILPVSSSGSMPLIKTEDDFNRQCQFISAKNEKGIELIKEISDDRKFIELKQEDAKGISTGFITLAGRGVGVMVSDVSMCVTLEDSLKAVDFINLCSKFDIPLFNIIGDSTFDNPASANMLIRALANSNLILANLIIGDACGSYYSVFNSKRCFMTYNLMWNDASVQIINPLHAADILYPNISLIELEERAIQYRESKCSAEAMEEYGYIDKVIRPEDSRKYLIGVFETLANIRR